jgi:hypothetical protein
MNERIKELLNQAGIYQPDRFDAIDGSNQMEKFAELIVRECLGIVKSNTYGPNGEYDYSYSDESAAADERAETIYKDISHRFGVEE